MSRSPTRTPPIRISPLFLTSVASLDEGAIAAVMRIAAYHAEAGRPMTVAEFGARTGEDGLFLHAVLQGISHLLDGTALASGQLVVAEIAQGLAHRAEIMSKRSEAANLRYVRAAAEQKAKGGEVKLTRGRVSGRRKGATAVGMQDASDPSGCTHVHNQADYAHLQPDDGCTHVHNDPSDAHVCNDGDGTHVHNSASDAHVYIEGVRDSDDPYAHMCIPSSDADPEPTQNRGFSMLDSFEEPSHVHVRAARADLSISNPSLDKKKRVESARTHVRSNDAHPEADGRRQASRTRTEARGIPKAVAPSKHDHGAQHLHHEESVVASLPGYRPSAGSPAAAAVPAEFVRRLLEAGPVDGDTARRKLAEWIGRWGEPFVRSGVEAIPNKQIARPLSYLSSILTNLAKEAGAGGPARTAARTAPGAPHDADPAVQGLRMPLRVKRRVSVPPGAAWEQLGWTARGREGDTGPARRQVWRTESGDLRYMDAPPSDTIPSYEEDPGVYAYD
jgi:hypothetical protein